MKENHGPIRFIHTSDWQLGITRAFLGKEAAARYSQARVDVIGTLARHALEHDAEFMVVAGDVFESNQISRQTLMRALDALESLPIPVFLLPGNHDPLDEASIFSTPEFYNTSDHIIVLRDRIPVAVPGVAGVEVVGAPWYNKHPNTDLCRDMGDSLEAAGDMLRVAVAHGQIDTLSPDVSSAGVIVLADVEQALADHRYHYLALGDRHSLTPVGESGRVWFSGSPVTTAFVEKNPNKALLVELGRAGTCDVRPLETGSWRFVEYEQEMNGEADLAVFSRWLNELSDKERTAIKVGFVGSVNLATAAALEDLMETRAELFASLRRRERTTDLAVMPDDLDQDSVSLSGYAREAWDELLALAGNGDEIAGDALRLFYRLSGAGKR